MYTNRRPLKLMIALLAAVGLFSATFAAAGFSASDLSGHWAESQMNAWINQGYLAGYPDGTVRPDAPVTRAEFMALANRAYSINTTGSGTFKDVPDNAWYAAAVRTAYASGYISGYPDSTMRPNNPINRYEAAVILFKITRLTGDTSGIYAFNDFKSIPSWAQEAVGTVYRKDIMTGYPNGSFSGSRSISRAESVVALSRGLSQASGDKTYSRAGTYGTDSMTTVAGNVLIKASGVTLQNMTIKGNLTLDREIGSGDVTLKNVIIRGTSTFNGGGSDSVYLTDVVAPAITVARDSGKLRMVLSGSSYIDRVNAKSDMILEEKNLTGSGADVVVAEVGQYSTVDVELINVKPDQLDMSNTDGTLTLDSHSTVTRLTVNARYTRILTVKGSLITTLVANAPVTVSGAGTINRAEVNATGVVFETRPTTVVVKSGVSAPTYLNPIIESFSPADGAKDVALNANIVITFAETMRNSDNSSLTNANVDGLITLRKDDSGGSSVAFDATVSVSGSKTIITINPTLDFDADRSYYVSVYDLENASNQALGGNSSVIFTTLSSDIPRVESFVPQNGETNVSLASNILINLSEILRKTDNSSLTSTNVDSLITLRKGSSSGTSVSFDATVATVSGKTVITVNPVSTLSPNTAYYIAVSGLEDSNNQALTGTLSALFTTVPVDAAPAVQSFSPANGASGVASDADISITFTETVRNLNDAPLDGATVSSHIVFRKSSSSGANVPFTATVSTAEGKTVITVNPNDSLLSNQSYYIAVNSLEDGSNQLLTGTLNAVFSTADPVPTVEAFNPQNGAVGISLDSNVTIRFSETVRLLNNTALSNSNVDAQIIFRTPGSTGTDVPFNATVDSSGGKTVITVNPSADLTASTTYYLSVNGLEDSSNQGLSGSSSVAFTTLTPSADVLTNLSIALGIAGDGGSVTLNPDFSGSVMNYTATIPDTVSTVLVTPAVQSDNTATVRLADIVKTGGVADGLVYGSNALTITVSKPGTTDLVYHVTLTLSDTTAPAYVSAQLSANKKLVTIAFSENLVSNSGDLKASVTFAADGTGFVPLGPLDTVAISDNQLLIALSSPLTGTTNRFSVSAGALRDTANNILSTPIQTDLLSAE